jgi:DNA-binding NarL/FixJ family response regulator
MPRLLIVDDDPLITRAVALRAPPTFECIAAASRAEAEAALAGSRTFDGVLADLGLPEGCHSGLDLVVSLRERDFRGVAGVFTGGELGEVAGRIADLGAFLLAKPFDRRSLDSFFRCVERASWKETKLDDAVAVVLDEFPFTAREREVVASAVEGRQPSDLAMAMGLSDSTLETHARSVLRKTGKKRMQAVAIEVLRRAFERTRAS